MTAPDLIECPTCEDRGSVIVNSKEDACPACARRAETDYRALEAELEFRRIEAGAMVLAGEHD